MAQLLAFLMAIFLVGLLVMKARLQPFLSLVVSALVYGLLTGMGSEVIDHLAAGLARIFSALAIVIFSGAVIAEYLRETGAVNRIVADLRRVAKGQGMMASGLSGYLVTLPAMCCITSYLILEPVVRVLGREEEGAETRFQFMVAVSSVISFNLIYPSPVMIALSESTGVSPVETLKMALPISILLLILARLYLSRLPSMDRKAPAPEGPLPSRAHSWTPLVLPLLLIVGGLLFESETARLLGNPNLALLLGALVSVALAHNKAQGMIRTASRRAGVIIFDLCGAGAFGYVIAQSGLGAELHASVGPWVPPILLPFLMAATLQLAQGSRVVTAVIASEVMRGYPLDGLTLVFLICAGAFTLSYVSDPYFWLVSETTRSGLKDTVRGYTLPLTLCGLVVFAIATLRWFLFF